MVRTSCIFHTDTSLSPHFFTPILHVPPPPYFSPLTLSPLCFCLTLPPLLSHFHFILPPPSFLLTPSPDSSLPSALHTPLFTAPSHLPSSPPLFTPPSLLLTPLPSPSSLLLPPLPSPSSLSTVNIDMTRVLTAVLLQETQPLDSKGESTIASTYTSWYVCKGWRGGGEKGEGLMKGWGKGRGGERGGGNTAARQ